MRKSLIYMGEQENKTKIDCKKKTQNRVERNVKHNIVRSPRVRKGSSLDD